MKSPQTETPAETLEEIAERVVREWVEHDLDEHWEPDYDCLITTPPTKLIERFLSALRNEREICAKVADERAAFNARQRDQYRSQHESRFADLKDTRRDEAEVIARAIREGR